MISPTDAVYREHLPAARLRPWISCYWSHRTASAGAAPRSVRVLPDGSADVVLRLGSGGVEGIVVGPMGSALAAPAPPGLFFGVRFRPGSARSFLGVPLAALADQRVDFADLWPRAGALLEGALAAADTGGLVGFFDEELELRARSAACSPLVARAVDALAADPGRRIQHLADRLGVSRQHLARCFDEEVGQSPKLLARVFRFRSTLLYLCSGAVADLASVAAEAGYSDQSHMNADFRELGGASPLAFLRESSAQQGSQVPILQDSAGEVAHNGSTVRCPPPLMGDLASAAEECS